MKKHFQKIASFVLALVVCVSTLTVPAFASPQDAFYYGVETFQDWLSGSSGEPLGGWNIVDWSNAMFSSNKPKKYYTTPTESVEDKYGNVTNYYRGGDTTNTTILDSYNKTFNNIWNTNNTTNNYSANVKLNDFLNTYTTNNNNYTYNANFKSWYYDNDTNNYNFADNRLYYNEDNRQYYITIDNSTDEYYMIDVQYSPTFVTVNYDYSTTNNNITNNYGDVTNVYYFELTDGRNSSTLSASEVAGLDLGYDVANYVLVPDDPNTLSLQHFDGNYEDSSSYGRTFYSENRSTNYVDSGAFGQAVKLPSGSAAGVNIPDLSGYDGIQIDFRLYFDDFRNVDMFLGETNLNQKIQFGTYSTNVNFTDSGTAVKLESRKSYNQLLYTQGSDKYLPWERNEYSGVPLYTPLQTLNKSNLSVLGYQASTSLVSSPVAPQNYEDFAHLPNGKTGWFNGKGKVTETGSTDTFSGAWLSTVRVNSDIGYRADYIKVGGQYKWSPDTPTMNTFPKNSATNLTTWGNFWYEYDLSLRDHYRTYKYQWTPTEYVSWDYESTNYKNQWVSFRIVIKGGQLYYFVNGDCVGSGPFDAVTADKFYIQSNGALYLDELRITTGDMVSTGTYTASEKPYDTNKVLALPDEMTANTIYVRHSIPVSSFRIGGVRPSNPTAGFFYIPLHDDYTGGQPQLYDGSNWVDVEAMVYDGSATKSALGYKFAPVGSSPDVDTDLQPGRPTKPGEDVDQSTCTHTWEATGRKDPTCTLNGAIEYTCSKCKATKSEAIPAVGHTWEVKNKVETTYDESGNVVTQGFTIYKCSVCQEEYKDTEGKGPPQVVPPEDSGGDNWFTKLMKKLGELLGTTVGGLLELVGTAIGKVLDSLISIVTTTIEKLKEVVNLFGSFGDAMGVFWSWLPSEIVTVLVLGVTVLVFLAIIRIFLK